MPTSQFYTISQRKLYIRGLKGLLSSSPEHCILSLRTLWDLSSWSLNRAGQVHPLAPLPQLLGRGQGQKTFQDSATPVLL